MDYTSNQQRAIDHWEGNLQIIACAGSGKTDVITRRIANLVVSGVPTRAIVAFTFTENAAEEMKFRVRKHLQELRPDDPEIGEMYIGTVHSFCLKLLQDFKPLYKGYDVLDEHKRVILISTYNNFEQIGLDKLFPRSFDNIQDFCFNIDILREEIIPLERLPDNFRHCFEKYQQLLQQERFLDFSGMMYEVYQLLLSDQQFASRVFNRFKYIIVDEYQDINPLQERIIELLASHSGNLCVVGDDDQCIYQWRGSFVENLLTFKDRYPNVESIEITTNFRSSKIIVDSAREFIEHNLFRLPKQITAWDEAKLTYDPGDVYAVQFHSDADELHFILDRIESLRGTKYLNNKGEEYALDYRDMAVFFRSVKLSADEYIRAFKDRGIPFIVKGGGKLFEQEEVVLMTKAFSFVADCQYDDQIVTVDNLHQLYQQTFGEWGDARKFVDLLVNFKQTTEMNDYLSLQGVFQQFLGFMGGMDFEFSETQLYNLGMFSQAITDFEAIYKRIKLFQVKYFLGFVHAYAKWNYEEGGSDDPTKINAVKIMTVHRSKGLQFPIVFVPHLQDGLFPSRSRPRVWLIPEELFNKDRYEGKLEDERRLFYVAITRSEKYLFLTCHQFNVDSNSKVNPSRFFSEYPRHYALTQPIADPTTRERLDLKAAAPLRRFATSYSDLRYYDHCPYDYKLRFIFGFNPEIAIALGYGKSIHNILNVIHSDYRKDPPDEATVQKIINNHFFLRYCSPEFNTRFRESARRIIQNYVNNYSGEFNLILETEKAFEFALDQTLISGKIDLIKMLNDKGELEAIEIVDFKEHESSELSSDYIKQLRLYAIASIRSLGFHPQQAAVHHLDEGTKTMVDISQETLTTMEETVKETVDSIIAREFPKEPSKRKCKTCDWRYFCTKK